MAIANQKQCGTGASRDIPSEQYFFTSLHTPMSLFATSLRFCPPLRRSQEAILFIIYPLSSPFLLAFLLTYMPIWALSVGWLGSTKLFWLVPYSPRRFLVLMAFYLVCFLFEIDQSSPFHQLPLWWRCQASVTFYRTQLEIPPRTPPLLYSVMHPIPY